MVEGRSFNVKNTTTTTTTTIEAGARPQRHRLDADKFSMLSGGWTWHGFCSDDLNPVGLSRDLSL